MDSDRENVTLLLFAAELAMVERSRQLLNAPDQHEERTELAVAKAALRLSGFTNWVGLRLQRTDFHVGTPDKWLSTNVIDKPNRITAT